LFQLNKPDLDFGFYRIMQARARQVRAFIDKDLLQIIEDAFGKVDKDRKAAAEAAVNAAVDQAIKFGAPDPETTQGVQEARAAYNAIKDSATAESDVYDHLYRFFERYYDDGDFISRRYYTRENAGKAAPFAIPYNGEEVKLHWANADQYYIKTAEYFSNFTFDITRAAEIQKMSKEEKVLNQVPDTPLKIHFRIVDATEGEHGNVKATEDKKRFFVLHEEDSVQIDDMGVLAINFEYTSLPGGKNDVDPDMEKSLKELYGKSLNKGDMPNLAIARKIINAVETLDNATVYGNMLKLAAPTDKIPNRPLLARYVNQYTARNTMDYFIHKDLGGFLKRELDFYIKNEVMHLDDIENADAPAVEGYLSKIKVIRKIATKLIEFMAQLEEFQKKLWLKKKFVVETSYCITLDRIPEAMYPQIAANPAQIEEWINLFAIDEIKAVDGQLPGMGKPIFSNPPTIEFLKANDKLVLDTTFFSEEFKAKLIESIEDFDEQCDGLLIHSENFQALNLLQERYREQVKCVYIDPPYNTGGDGFAYKDNYQHASWLTMISERLSVAYPLFSEKGVLFSSIDAGERNRLEHALNSLFQPSNRVEEIIWVQNTTKNQSPTYSTNHEYIEVFAKNISAVKSDFAMFRESKPGYIEIMELIEGMNPSYPLISEVESALKKLYRDHLAEIKNGGDTALDDWKGIYNYNRAEYRDLNGRYIEEKTAKALKAKIWIWREDNPSMPQVKEDSQKPEFRDPDDPTFRFYTPIHPITGKSCPAPKRGWSWPYNPHGNQKNCFSGLAEDQRIAWGKDENKIPQTKRFLHEVETNVSKSVVNDYTDGEKQLTNLFGKTRSFGGPKPTTLIRRICQQSAVNREYVCDFFAGSGTTGDAVINLNREDQLHRKLMLVEMGEHFDTVLKPRIIKVIYSSNWKDGKPTTRDTGISHCFKTLRLESYEDTLNNLEFENNPTRDRVMEQNKELREDYMLHYLLDVETRGSQSLLNIDNFANPMAYTLKVKKPGSDEQATRAVDLVESFNYLMGLRLVHMAAPQRFTATFIRKPDPELPEDQHTRLLVDGEILLSSEGKWWFRKIEGWVPAEPMTPNNGWKEKVLIVWRNLSGNLEEDNLMLDEWFIKYCISDRDFKFDTIYVNGSNNLSNLKKEGVTWTVRLIEEAFHKRMWEKE